MFEVVFYSSQKQLKPAVKTTNDTIHCCCKLSANSILIKRICLTKYPMLPFSCLLTQENTTRTFFPFNILNTKEKGKENKTKPPSFNLLKTSFHFVSFPKQWLICNLWLKTRFSQQLEGFLHFSVCISLRLIFLQEEPLWSLSVFFVVVVVVLLLLLNYIHCIFSLIGVSAMLILYSDFTAYPNFKSLPLPYSESSSTILAL